MSDAEEAWRAKALDAALDELQQWGVDRFSIQGVAQRSSLSAQYLRQTWESERQLIVEALTKYSQIIIVPPDTGSLRGDLTELALSLAVYLNEPVGRRIVRMLVVDSRSQAVDTAIRFAFWSKRRALIEVVFRRAADRGELRDGVRPAVALQLLTAPLHTFALYSNDPVEADYCRAVADLVARAVSAA